MAYRCARLVPHGLIREGGVRLLGATSNKRAAPAHAHTHTCLRWTSHRIAQACRVPVNGPLGSHTHTWLSRGRTRRRAWAGPVSKAPSCSTRQCTYFGQRASHPLLLSGNVRDGSAERWLNPRALSIRRHLQGEARHGASKCIAHSSGGIGEQEVMRTPLRQQKS